MFYYKKMKYKKYWVDVKIKISDVFGIY